MPVPAYDVRRTSIVKQGAACPTALVSAAPYRKYATRQPAAAKHPDAKYLNALPPNVTAADLDPDASLPSATEFVVRSDRCAAKRGEPVSSIAVSECRVRRAWFAATALAWPIGPTAVPPTPVPTPLSTTLFPRPMRRSQPMPAPTEPWTRSPSMAHAETVDAAPAVRTLAVLAVPHNCPEATHRMPSMRSCC